MKRLALLLLVVAACGGEAPPPAPPPPPAPTPIVSSPPPPADPLGPRPSVPPPAPFTPPVPVVYERAGGMKVWLLERHALPIVSIEVVTDAGGASEDPPAKAGLAMQTANMLDEGAGTRGALDLARDVDRLGATLHTGVYADYGFAQLTTLKKNLAPAAAIFGDVLAKPTFSPVEWKRVHDLWVNDLKQRASEPSAVAGVVVAKKLFGEGHPYASPNDGTTKSAENVTLDDLKKFYSARWRPSHATCVVVGDVTRAELDGVLDAAFAGWTNVSNTGWSKSGKAPPKGRRIVVVDRADAPQSVIAVARIGVEASSPDAPALVRVNAALGGSFTSRLNQDLREEHGWSYGAKSRFSFNAFPGVFVAQAAVQTAHTGDALKAMLNDLETYAKEGPTDAEVEKTRLIARGDLVEAYETVDATAHRLARYAGVGLPASQDAAAAAKTAAATKADLAALAKKYVDPTNALVVIVGPRAKIAPQLEAIGMGSFETSGPEGE